MIIAIPPIPFSSSASSPPSYMVCLYITPIFYKAPHMCLCARLKKHCGSDRPLMPLLDDDYRTFPPLPPPRPLQEALWDSAASLNSSTACFILSTCSQTPYLFKRK